MDPVSNALTLVQALCKRAADVRTNADDCKQLAEFAKRTVPFLEHLSTHSAIDLGINRGLEAVVEALELADAAVTECCKSTAFVAVLYSDKIADQLKKAASTLSYALSLLSTANVGLAAETQEEIFSLKEQLKNVHFSQAAAAREQASELKRLLETGFNTNAEATVEMKEMMQALLANHSKTQDDQQADLELLKGCLADARRNKERLEEYELQQVISAIEAGATASQMQSGGATSSGQEEDLLCHLLCPISMDRMIDPVLVKESGMTYDRASIRTWFGRGYRNDPQTNVPLVSMELIPNVVVRRLLHAVMRREGKALPEDSAADTSLGEVGRLRPGLLEGRRRTNKGDGGQGVVYIALLLDVTGNVLGFQELFSDDSESRERCEISSGCWDQESVSFHRLDKDGRMLVTEGSFSDRLSTNSCAVSLKLTEKVSARMIERNSEKEWEQPVVEKASEFPWIAPPPPVQHHVLSSGLVQMDGLICRRGGEDIRNRLLLIFHADGTVKGWLHLETEDEFSSSLSGKIWEGKWDAAELMLSFCVDFFLAKDLSEKESKRRPLFRASFTGEISHVCSAATGPAFVGMCHLLGTVPTGEDAVQSHLVQALDNGARFEYRHFAVTSVPFALSQTKEMVLMRPPAESGYMPGYTGPGIYKIRMESCIDGQKEHPCIGRYLTVTQHYRHPPGSGKFCCWIGWTADSEQAALWKIAMVSQAPCRVCIRFVEHPSISFERDVYVTAHNTVKEDPRDANSIFAMAVINKGSWMGKFQFQRYESRQIAVIHNIIQRNQQPQIGTKGVLSAADLTHSRDKMDDSTIAAIVSKDWQEAAGLALLRVAEKI